MEIERFHDGSGPLDDDPLWPTAREIRVRVFVEEQSCPWDEEFDGFDPDARHLLGTVDGQPAATARWRVVDGVEHGEPMRFAKLERFAILPEFRGHGRGKALVSATLGDARDQGHRHFVLNAQVHLEGFYRGLGFEPTDHRFMEAGIPHVKMVRHEPVEAG